LRQMNPVPTTSEFGVPTLKRKNAFSIIDLSGKRMAVISELCSAYYRQYMHL
jgi:hypothetical protein